ncbi:MAG: Bax inhibitor-1 family protein [Romboutsia sp.]|uniref:Bax inhibitor-1 family protein n=1 Tax=Romboutsia sp. TaxID=1965302 RepID=UPI003F419DF6
MKGMMKMNYESKMSYAKNPMQTIFTSLAISLIFMAIGFVVGILFVPVRIAYMANTILGIVLIGLVVLSMFSRKAIIPRSFSITYVYIFTFVYGIILYPVLLYYLQVLGISVFLSVVLGGVGLFAVLAIQASRKEAGYYISMGNVLFAGLIGILIASLINVLLFRSNFLSIIVSVIAVVIFSAYVMYDVSVMKAMLSRENVSSRNDLSIFVLNLYLDLINLILNLLNVASYFDNN